MGEDADFRPKPEADFEDFAAKLAAFSEGRVFASLEYDSSKGDHRGSGALSSNFSLDFKPQPLESLGEQVEVFEDIFVERSLEDYDQEAFGEGYEEEYEEWYEEDYEGWDAEEHGDGKKEHEEGKTELETKKEDKKQLNYAKPGYADWLA